MLQFFSGAIAMGYAIAGLFFLRFWARSRDNLFLVFAASFWLLALNQGITGLGGISREELSLVYLLRLLAFSLIIWAIIRKNLGNRPPHRSP